ncbi:hypothetical protein ACI51W_06390 [Pseudomonas marginalis]|uniref:hypothetical protein n=1 Tax=Pseudomonas TaxID=286 RepID=UPI00048783CB|nr:MULTISPECIES: hypothetical protein [unclassified Pseudomonas]PUB45651.1 hypothetical protein C8K58_105496 [Pseudomonas sp. GV047]SMF25630.1 hypothetical protein SAMN05660912_02462 [Pseudomonas sp. LAMO17WK12:I1]
MSGVPKSKLSEMHKSFDDFALGYSHSLTLNEIHYARLKADLESFARKAKATEAAKAYAQLAHLVSYKFDSVKFFDYLSRAEGLAGRNEDWCYGYLSGAVNLGYFSEARQLIDSVGYDNDVWWLNYKFNIYSSMCLFEQALECARSLVKMSSEDHDLVRVPSLVPALLKAYELIGQSGIDSEKIFEMVCVAAKVIGEKLRKPLAKYSLSADFESGVLYSFSLNEPAEVMVDLEWQIMEHLVEEVDLDASGLFTVNVSYPSQ